MNKKSTLLAAALMAVSSFTANAKPGDSVVPKDWTAENYYYLKTVGGKYLSLHEEKRDSVVVLEKLGKTKADADLALWEITVAKTEATGISYKLRNKKTKALLAFDKNLNADPVLNTEGVTEWSLTEKTNGAGKGYAIKSQLNSTQVMELHIDTQSKPNPNKLIFDGSKGAEALFNAVEPENNKLLTASDLGDGFTTFRLSLGEKIEGDIFSGKDLIATTKDENGEAIDGNYVMLQEKGNEAKGYFGIDTLQTSGAGYKFSLDSVRTKVQPNKSWKLFQFKADLKNDSLTMIVKELPNKDTEVKVVYVQLDDKKVLTVLKDKGICPFITASRGIPAEISTGEGVYFLKHANKDANEGKYLYVGATGVTYKKEKPSVNKIDGQWLISENDGMYKIVSRQFKENTVENHPLLDIYSEIFAVQGSPNTYLIGNDSITVECQKVDLKDKYLGSINFTAGELADNGYALNLVPDASSESNLYAVVSNSVLQIKAGDSKNAQIFKLIPNDTLKVGGALALKDTVYVVSYKLKAQFSSDSVFYDTDKKCLVLSKLENALAFRFKVNAAGDKYSMQIVNGVQANKYVSSDVNTTNMIASDNIAYFNLVEVDAPEYASLKASHKRFTSNALDLSLTMNPLNFYAEAKREGQSILKSDYAKDNFNLWVSESKASTPGKPLYFIATSLPNELAKAEAERTLYYLVSGRDSAASNESLKVGNYYRANFIANDTIETMKNNAENAALFAFKATEDGGYLLENQKELTRTLGANEIRIPYLGVKNGVVLMMEEGVPFEIETVSGPVANENIEAPTAIKVIGGVGEFSIRNAHGKKITISNILGQTIDARVVSSDYITVPTTRGVVIVSVEGDQAYKVIVK